MPRTASSVGRRRHTAAQRPTQQHCLSAGRRDRPAGPSAPNPSPITTQIPRSRRRVAHQCSAPPQQQAAHCAGAPTSAVPSSSARQCQRRQRRQPRGFPHHRRCRRPVPRPVVFHARHRDREAERGDHAHHSQRCQVSREPVPSSALWDATVRLQSWRVTAPTENGRRRSFLCTSPRASAVILPTSTVTSVAISCWCAVILAEPGLHERAAHRGWRAFAMP